MAPLAKNYLVFCKDTLFPGNKRNNASHYLFLNFACFFHCTISSLLWSIKHSLASVTMKLHFLLGMFYSLLIKIVCWLYNQQTIYVIFVMLYCMDCMKCHVMLFAELLLILPGIHSSIAFEKSTWYAYGVK